MLLKNATALLRFAFGIAVLVGLVLYFDVKEIFRPLATIQVKWVFASALLILCTTLISAVNRHIFINLERQITFRDFLRMYWVAWAIGLLVPGQVGDVAALGAMLKRKGMTWPESIGRSLADKVISFSIMLSLGLLGIFRVASLQFGGAFWLVAAALLIIVGLFSLLYINRKQLAWATSIFVAIGKTWEEFYKACVHNPGKVILNAGLTLLGIGLTGAAYWSMFAALGHESSLLELTLLMAACSIVAYIPVSFNGIGTVEAAGIALFGLIGLQAPAVLSAYLCLRLIVFALAWTPAILILMLPTPAVHK